MKDNCNIFDDFDQDESTLEVDLAVKLETKVIKHRNKYYRNFINKYMELLPAIFAYYGDDTNINFLLIERMLVSGLLPVIGYNKLKKLTVLGYCINDFTLSNVQKLFAFKRLTKKDIFFTIPKRLIPDGEMLEIIEDFDDGNFIVFRNKIVSYNSDYDLIRMYADEIAENIASRYSLEIQSKVFTAFTGDDGDLDILDGIAKVYNGSPFLKVSKAFDINENIIKFNNAGLESNINTLKNMVQQIKSELNNDLSIDDIAVQKESGVSDSEVSGNENENDVIANSRLASRRQSLKLMKEFFNIDVKCTPVLQNLERLKAVAYEIHD